MPRGPQKRLEVTATAELLSALAGWAGPTLYLSRGYGPRAQVGASESPDYVRVALIPGVAFAEVQAARARWLAEAAALGPVEDGEIDRSSWRSRRPTRGGRRSRQRRGRRRWRAGSRGCSRSGRSWRCST